MQSVDKRYRPRLLQAFKVHLVATATGILLVTIMLVFKGVIAGGINDPLLALFALFTVCLIVSAFVLSFDVIKFRKHSAREIVLTREVLQIELADGRRTETKWSNVRSGESANLIWKVVTADETITFSVAGLSFQEQKELAEGIADLTAAARA